jgi:hypothetical protein
MIERGVELTIIKRSPAGEHLVQQYAERPPVDTYVVPDVLEHIGARYVGVPQNVFV